MSDLSENPNPAFAQSAGYVTVEYCHGYWAIKSPAGEVVALALYSLGEALKIADELNRLRGALVAIADFGYPESLPGPAAGDDLRNIYGIALSALSRAESHNRWLFNGCAGAAL